MQRRKVRPLIIGRDGIGKSYFAGTWPKPLWVFLFDPPDKAGVYLERGNPGPIEGSKYCYFQDVFSNKSGDRIIHLEYWGESNPNEPKMYMRFLGRTARLEQELVDNKVETACFDSATHFELMSRFYSENAINKYNQEGEITKDPRKHYGFSAHAIEQFIMVRWPNLIMCNALMIGHPGELEKDDSDDGEGVTSVRTVELPGKIAAKIGTAYSEVWRLYKDGEGNRRLQTQPRPKSPYACKTSIGVPDGIAPHYKAIFPDEEEKSEPLGQGKSA